MTFKTLFLLFLCALTDFFIVFSQNLNSEVLVNCDTTSYNFNDYVDSLSAYEIQMGNKKHLHTKDKRLKLAFYVALQHYPELQHKKISLKLKSINSTMQAQPSPNFIVKRKIKRGYSIFVNNNSDLTGLDYTELSFNGLVGWIGHEFAHLIDYSSMNNRELLGFITAYIFDKRTMRKTERQADKETIKRGLGIQLLDGVAFFEKNKKVSKRYRKRKKKNYLSEEEIIVDINRNCH